MKITQIESEKIYAPVNKEMERVERILREELEGEMEELIIPARSILFAQAKRLRPALLLNICKMLGRVRKEAYYLAAVVELIHTASLIHDDIVDEADKRRGQPSVNAKWGDKRAVLVGDFLVARASRLALKYGDKRILSLLADTVERMSKGETLEVSLRGKGVMREKDYLRIIDLKTASLFSACARAGAILGRATPLQEKHLTHFGRYIGLAFQITDDLLNIIGEEKVLGKPTSSDIERGNLTLPLLALLGDERREKVREVLRRYWGDPQRIKEVLEKNGGIRKARKKAEGFVRRAKRFLEIFPPSPSKEALLTLCDFVIMRER